MAHKKGVGSSKNGRESESKRLGVENLWRTSSESWKYPRASERYGTSPRCKRRYR